MERWDVRALGALLMLMGWASCDLASPMSAQASCPNDGLRVGASAGLSDCRAYEQISPINKGGFAAYPTLTSPVQVSSSGEAIAYLNLSAFPGAVGNTALRAAHVSTRTTHGWETAEWTPMLPKAEALTGYKVNYIFSSDLSQAILQVPLIPLTPNAIPNAENLFLRDSGGAYSLITSASPTISVEELCGRALLNVCWAFDDLSAYAGASSDFSHVLFESIAQLMPEAPATGVESLYENTAGSVHLVGILPDGAPAASSTAGAGSSVFFASGAQQADRSVERAMSQDGSHVVFQAPADGGAPDPAQGGLTEVYDRIAGAETVEISAPAPEATPAVTTPEPAMFQTASVDGSRVFFTSSAELTTQSNTGPANNSQDLYEYNLETEQLTDLMVDTNPQDASTGAMVQGVVDSSSDGSYVYFVADGQLVEGEGVDGQPNLYMVHNAGKPVFIATLNGAGGCNFSNTESADSCDWSSFPVVREAYVTPDGKHMAFTSTQRLPTVNFPSGYNNIDQETGKADSEIYEYTAPTRSEGRGQLICVSCAPTGAQPIGDAHIGGIAPNGGLQEGRVGLSGISTPFNRVRVLTDNGRRLFYAAPASLATPYDSVYEYEQDGEGTCTTAGGCQNLFSDLSTSEADYFLGSSSDGRDVYLATSSRLSSTDRDNVRDVYDARVDGGIMPPSEEERCHSNCLQSSTTPTDPPLSSDSPVQSGNLPPASPPRKCKTSFKPSHDRCVKTKKPKHRKHSKKKTKTTRENRRTR
jgi:WD40 repeat protein